MSYKLVKNSNGSVVAFGPNCDEYDPFISEGYSLDISEELPPADPIPELVVPPIAVSPWQIRKALNQLDLRDAVEHAVAVADQTTQDAWQYATEFVRTDPLVVNVGLALGKSDAELDSLFELAASL